MRYANAAADRATGCCIPCGINPVLEGTAGVRIHSNHRFVVEMVGASGHFEECRCREAPSAIRGFRHCHLSAVDAISVAEEDNDIAVKEIAKRVEGERRV